MHKVTRDELLDYQTYTEQRDEIRARVMAAKSPRRILVGDLLSFLFENRDTVRYQVQEMMRVEQIVREADIEHELATYNELLGGPGELGCALLIEIAEEAGRPELLRALLGLNDHLYAELADGTRVAPAYDARQVGEDRLSAVQYLRFDTGGQVPVALGSTHPTLTCRAELTPAQAAALAEDLASDSPAAS